MILTALVKYYEALAAKDAISPRGYGLARASYALRLSPEGDLLDVVSLLKADPEAKKPVERPQVFKVPEPVLRTVGVLPNFLCDNSGYLVGYDEKGKPERTLECFKAAKALHLNLLKTVDSPVARAVCAYFETWRPALAAEHPALSAHLTEIAAGGNLIFMLDLAFAQDDPAICAAWEKHAATQQSAQPMVCLATGERAPAAVLHPKIKGVRGGQSSGTSLVSFNARAFESYGRDEEQGLNAPVSEYAAFAYTTALNQLIADERHRKFVGDMTLVYWSEDANERASNFFDYNLDTFAAAPDVDAMLGDVFGKLSRGEPIGGDIDANCPFYVLGLSPNASRLSVRFFLRDKFGVLAERLRGHYQRLEIVRPSYDTIEYLTVPRLLSETVNPFSKSKQSPELMTGAFVRDLLSGYRYPQSLYAMTLMRVRAEQKVSRGRAAIIKAYLLRNTGNESTKEALTVALNTETDNQAYLLGRLFSILEGIQSDANPGINATIKDRYFNAACAMPATVFPTLIKLSNNHLRKLDTGFRINGEKAIQGIMMLLPEKAFPPRLSLEQQGLFISGYYHQTQDRFTPKKNK